MVLYLLKEKSAIPVEEEPDEPADAIPADNLGIDTLHINGLPPTPEQLDSIRNEMIRHGSLNIKPAEDSIPFEELAPALQPERVNSTAIKPEE